MAKRIVTKIGNIFCVEIENEHKRYFQYIANDLAQLNSSVIRVFKRKYPMEHVFDVDEVIDDEIEFYAHTMLRPGIVANIWYKVGKSANVGNLDDIVFVSYNELVPDSEKCNNWYLWVIGCEPVFIGKLTDYIESRTHQGDVYNPHNIYKRLKNGKWHFNIPR